MNSLEQGLGKHPAEAWKEPGDAGASELCMFLPIYQFCSQLLGPQSPAQLPGAPASEPWAGRLVAGALLLVTHEILSLLLMFKRVIWRKVCLDSSTMDPCQSLEVCCKNLCLPLVHRDIGLSRLTPASQSHPGAWREVD